MFVAILCAPGSRKIYHQTPERERKNKKIQLTRILSVPERTLQSWLSRIDKDAKESRDKRIIDMWLACYTEQEIADDVGIPRTSVETILTKTAELPNPSKVSSEHLTNFEPPLFKSENSLKCLPTLGRVGIGS